MPELALDDAKRMFLFGTHACLERFTAVCQFADGRALVQRTALTRAHRHVPCDLGVLFLYLSALRNPCDLGVLFLYFSALRNPLIARIAVRSLLLTVQQLGRLRHIVHIGPLIPMIVTTPVAAGGDQAR